MEINIGDNFTLLFDKNNNTAYKALQMLQKQVIAKQVNDSSQRGGITELDYLREWNTFRKGIELGHGL